MDSEPFAPERTDTEVAGFSPLHHYATPDTRVDLSKVKPHACMTNIKQIGNYVHCYNGNHGMRLGPHDMLVQNKDGQFEIVQITPTVTEEPKESAPALQSKRKRAKL